MTYFVSGGRKTLTELTESIVSDSDSASSLPLNVPF